MNAIRQIAKRFLTACVGRERLLVRGPGSPFQQRTLALTFDDGPHPEHTPRLLDRLDELGLRATFFVIGQHAAQSPDLIRRMSKAGHEVANHTYSHSEPRLTSTGKFLSEIQQTDELLSSLIGQPSTTVRPPKGELNWNKLRGLWKAGKTVALWNIDPKDYRMQHGDEMNRWCTHYQPQDGDVVLLHDNHPYALQAIERLAARNLFEDFKTTTIHQWISQQA